MMKSSKFTTSSFLLALVALFSVSSVFVTAQDDSNSTECQSISEILCTEGLNLNALCEAISISELNDDLDEDAWTIFAPTDEAFEALGRDNLDSLVMSNDTIALTDLLLFHIVPGVSLTSDLLPCVAGSNLLEMANGEDSRTLCEDRVVPIEQRGSFNDKEDAPTFIEMDIMACNGVIHTLDKVMLYEPLPYEIPEVEPPLETEGTNPPSESSSSYLSSMSSFMESTDATGANDDEESECQPLYDLACSDNNFSTLCELLTENELADALNSGTWTVFAPTNVAFDNAPPISDDIEFVLLEHVIAGAAISAEELNCAERITMANGKDTRTVCKDEGTYQKGRGNSDEVRPEIIATNIEACNGIVHVVNEVILP